MSEIGRRLRDLFEEIAPSTTLDDALERGSPTRVMPSWLPAAALVGGVALAVVLGVWLSRPGEVVADSTTTTASLDVSTSTVAETTTSEAQAGPPYRPVHGGVVRIGLDFDYGRGPEGLSINPITDPMDASAALARLITPSAYVIDPQTGDLVPSLVESIPTITNGGVVVGANGVVTVSYRIREGAVWEDGTPITATDFMFTHEIIRRFSQPGGFATDVHGVVASVTGEGADVTVTLAGSDPRYVLLFEWVLPAHAVDPDTFDTDWTERLWLSGGPFRFVSFDAEAGVGEVLATFERNPNYWEGALPYLDGIDVVRLGHLDGLDPFTASSALLRDGTVDVVAGYGFPPYAGSTLQSAVEAGLELGAHYDGIIEVLLVQAGPQRLEHNPASLNHDPEYRRALLSAIDRPLLAGETGGLGLTSLSGLGFAFWDHDGWTVYDDGAAAADFLAGLDAAPDLVYYSTSGAVTIEIGDEILRQLTALGWDATAEYGGRFEPLVEGDFDVGALRLVGARPAGIAGLDLLTAFDPFSENAIFDWRAVGSAADEYRDLVAEANTEMDRSRLQGLLRAAEQVLIDAAVIYPLTYRQISYNPFWPDQVGGYVPSAHPLWDTANAAQWWSPQN